MRRPLLHTLPRKLHNPLRSTGTSMTYQTPFVYKEMRYLLVMIADIHAIIYRGLIYNQRIHRRRLVNVA